MPPFLIPHSNPTINSSDIKRVSQILQSGWIAQGKNVLDFETRMSQFLNVKGAVAVNSGTSALHLALRALNIGPRDEVMIPSFVCTALLNAVHYVGAKPRIVDVNPDDFNISITDIQRKLNRKTKVIIVPHMFGCPADIKNIVRLGVPVIEDCAQSIGADEGEKKVGSFGILSICSFYATKMMTTGEGGMVVSNQQKLLDNIRDWRAYDNVNDYKVRYNYKMTDFQAGLGLSQLTQLPEFTRRRKKIAQRFHQELNGLDFDLPNGGPTQDHLYFRYVIKLRHGQKEWMKKLNHQGIQAVPPVFKPLHRYVDQTVCPVSDQLMKQCLSFPIYPSLSETQVQYMINVIQKLFKTKSNYKEILP